MSPRPWLSPFLQPAAPELAIVLVAPLSMTAVCPGGAGGPQCALTKPGVLQEVWALGTSLLLAQRLCPGSVGTDLAW